MQEFIYTIRNKSYPTLGPIIVVVLLLVFGFACGIIDSEFVFDEISALSLLAIPLFLIILILSLRNDRNLSLFLPFVLIAFPVNINNIFPGVYIESPEMEVVYPFICHTELFLLLVLINRYDNSIHYNISFLPYFLIWTFIISTIAGMIKNYDSQYWLLLISGQYPIRLLILLLLLVKCIKLDWDCFVLGICLSFFFLILEAFVTTQLKGYDVLTSGSLGNNTFANVIAQLSCLLLYYTTWTNRNRNIIIMSLVVGLMIVFFAQTRMALLSSLVLFMFVVFPKFSKRFKIAFVLFAILLFVYIIKNSILSSLEGKMDVATTMSAIEISSISDINISQTETTSSLLTRLSLWETSIKMLVDNPLTGIGWNLFNVLKYDYGFDISVVIDPHNGYFLFLSQLGLFGILWVYYIFIKCWKCFRKSDNQVIKTFAVFNMGMTICELSNAGSYKYGVLSLLLFISVYVQNEYNNEVNAFESCRM